MSRPRVLVVDDDPFVKTLVARALRNLDLEVQEVGDGEEALRAIEEALPDLVVLDVELPGPSGLDVCAALRDQPTTRDVDVMIMAGGGTREHVEKAFAAGATDFISKPFDWALFEHRVRFLLRTGDALAQLRRITSELERNRQHLASAQRVAKVGSWEWDLSTDGMVWSDELYRILGREPASAEPSPRNLLNAMPLDDRAEFQALVQKLYLGFDPVGLDHRLRILSGEERIVHHWVQPILGPAGKIESFAGVMQDITERKRAELKVQRLAHYDSLTGLPNRLSLEKHLRRVIDRASRRQFAAALLLVDLDDFKRINDTLGHAIGDELLAGVAERLTNSVRMTDHVSRSLPEEGDALISRLGGDEFTLVLSEIDSPERAAQIARRVLEALSEPFSLRGQDVIVNASIGIAVHPRDGGTAEVMLRKADAAMYHAKEGGKHRYEFFNEHLSARVERKLRLERELRAALTNGELRLQYQPQVDAFSGEFVGVEALARWQNRDGSEIAPIEFIALAEEVGLIASDCERGNGGARGASASG